VIRDSSSMDHVVVAPRWSRAQVIAAAIAALLIIALAALLPAVRRWSRADRAVDATTVRFATVTRGDLQRDIAVQGKVVAGLHPTLFASAQGVVSLKVKAGAQVARGDLLAAVDSPELRSQLAQAQSQLASLRADSERQKIVARQTDLRNRQQVDLLAVRLEAARRALERISKSFAQGVGTRADLEAAQDGVRVAEMEHGQAVQAVSLEHETMAFDVASREAAARRQETIANELQQKFEGLAIRAPFAGMVASVNVQDRDAVAANAPILMLVNLSSYELQIALPEEYAGETRIGMPATIDAGGRSYDGELTAVSPEVVNSEVTATVAFRGVTPGRIEAEPAPHGPSPLRVEEERAEGRARGMARERRRTSRLRRRERHRHAPRARHRRRHRVGSRDHERPARGRNDRRVGYEHIPERQYGDVEMRGGCWVTGLQCCWAESTSATE